MKISGNLFKNILQIKQHFKKKFSSKAIPKFVEES